MTNEARVDRQSEVSRSMKRYDLITNYRAGSSIEEMERSDDGEWVRFEDVEGIIAGYEQHKSSLSYIFEAPLHTEIRRLLIVDQIQSNLRWIHQMQREICQEGHAGWGNTLDDVAGTLRDCAALLAASPAPPVYCAIHQHYKWCEHNGGTLGATGYGAPLVASPAPAEKEGNHADETRPELPAAVPEVRQVLRTRDERVLGSAVQAEQESGSEGDAGVQGLNAASPALAEVNLPDAHCRECRHRTGGGAYCYEHAPYRVWPKQDGTFLVDRHGMQHVTFTEPPAPDGGHPATTEGATRVKD